MFDPSATSMRFATPWNHNDASAPQLSSHGAPHPHWRAPARPRRRSRWLVLPTSVLLMIGLFLPTLQVCNDPVAPIQFPMFWTPHVVAILVFAAVLVRPWRLRGFDIALRVVLGLTAIGWGLVVVPSPAGMGGAGWLFSAALVAFIGLLVIPARSSESMVARCAVIGGAASSLWFGAIATDPDALFGAFSSTAASLGLTLGGLWWWLEQHLSGGEGHGQIGGDGRIV